MVKKWIQLGSSFILMEDGQRMMQIDVRYSHSNKAYQVNVTRDNGINKTLEEKWFDTRDELGKYLKWNTGTSGGYSDSSTRRLFRRVYPEQMKKEESKLVGCTFCEKKYPESKLWQSGGGVMVCPNCQKDEDKRGIKLGEKSSKADSGQGGWFKDYRRHSLAARKAARTRRQRRLGGRF